MLTEQELIEIKLGLVPEHFSSPIFQEVKKEDNLFVRNGLDLKVNQIAAGTGEMLKKVLNKELDMAIVVTEGFVSAKLKGDENIVVLGTYVESSLCWAASTGFQRTFDSADEIKGTPTFGISRYGSGSHVMAELMAKQHNWKIEEINYEVLNNIDGLSHGVKVGKADLFLWEYFTTKPLYDNKELKKIGQVQAPWPSFVIVTHKQSAHKLNHEIQVCIDVLNQLVNDFKINSVQSKQFIINYFNYHKEDVEEWFNNVKYPKNIQHINRSVMLNCIKILNNQNKEVDVEEWIHKSVAKWI